MTRKLNAVSLLAMAAFLLVGSIANGRIIYVDDNAAGANNGSSWVDAYKYLQDALMMASAGDELRVAQGIYKPDQFVLSKRPNLGRMETFQLKNEVAIRGGYAGLGQVDPNVRDIELYSATLSGERDTPRSNSYHAVTGSGTDSTAILDGFIIMGGSTYGSALTGGGGMYNDLGSPTVVNCTFTGNSARYGGGMYNVSSSPILTNCTFSGNGASRYGGGMYNEQNSNPTLTDCAFTGNSALIGGGMYNSNSAPRLTNCTFSGNDAVEEMIGGWEGGKGGGMYNWESSLLLTNCSFSANTSRAMRIDPLSGGGGMYNERNSSPTLTDCAFNDNSGNNGGGMYNEKNSNPTLTDCTFSGNEAVPEMFSEQGDGGGMYNRESSPILTNCTFSGNTSRCTDPHSLNRGGGGMYNDVFSNPTLTNCTFNDNSANNSGGMHNDHNSNPTMDYCIFRGNTAERHGGGMYNGWNSNPTLTNCIFSGNTAEQFGGGMHNSNSSPTLTNCTFSGNKFTGTGTWSWGGGMYNRESSPTLTNCTFSANEAQNGGGMYNEQNSNPTLSNCILWGDIPEEISLYYRETVVMTYSNVQGGFPGEGNIDVDPLFANPGYWDPNGTPDNLDDDYWVNGDYHLKSQAGRWDPNTQTWVQDDVTSPCIDAGDMSNPIGLELFPNGGIINMGAYGGTSEASKSYFGEPICETIIAGDINGDCKIDFRDFALMALHWLEDSSP